MSTDDGVRRCLKILIKILIMSTNFGWFELYRACIDFEADIEIVSWQKIKAKKKEKRLYTVYVT